jgi:hypothetical protein
MPGTVFREPSNAFTSTPINFSNYWARLPREPTTLPHPAFEYPKSLIFPVLAGGVDSTNSTLGEWIKNEVSHELTATAAFSRPGSS